MSSYTDFAELQARQLKKAEDMSLKCVICPKCGSQWFEEVEFQRYQTEHNLIVGQHIPARPGSVPFVMLRCGRCSNLIEPNIVSQARDIGARDYDHFLDTMEGKEDKRPDTIPSVEV